MFICWADKICLREWCKYWDFQINVPVPVVGTSVRLAMFCLTAGRTKLDIGLGVITFKLINDGIIAADLSINVITIINWMVSIRGKLGIRLKYFTSDLFIMIFDGTIVVLCINKITIIYWLVYFCSVHHDIWWNQCCPVHNQDHYHLLIGFY